jgi:hypothetical protein
MHGRNPDWTLEARHDGYPYTYGAFATAVRYRLTITLTYDQAEQLLGASDRGCPSFRHLLGSLNGTILQVSGIELTEAEALAIARGTSPLDVLFPIWPECGYRLVAVPDAALGW